MNKVSLSTDVQFSIALLYIHTFYLNNSIKEL